MDAALTRVRAALEKVQTRVAKGRLKQPAKIGAAVERVLQKNHGYRYYAWELRGGHPGVFEFEVALGVGDERVQAGKEIVVGGIAGTRRRARLLRATCFASGMWSPPTPPWYETASPWENRATRS